MASGARLAYRDWYRRLQTKHAGLYARRGELARTSELGLAQRMMHRFYWGPRPISARIEQALYTRLFGDR